jgi:tetratricopeptide (TPR) repeat protein
MSYNNETTEIYLKGRRERAMSKRLGLIIGANNYQDTTFQTLQYAENDARALAQWLVNVKGGAWSPGDVQLVQGTHATKELIESLITQMCLTLAEPDDTVLLYFAGHAFLDERNGDGYLALSNTLYANPLSGLHLLSFANQIMARCRAAHMLVILDCFQTGPAWQMRRASPYDVRPLMGPTLPAMLQQLSNRIFLCSCRGNAGAPETGERSLGMFMHRTIVGLSGSARDASTGQVNLQSLFSYLSSILGEQQSPRPFGQERTPLILVGDTAPTLPPQQQPPAPSTPPHNPTSSGGGLLRNSGAFIKQQPATATMSAPTPLPTNAASEQQMSPPLDPQRQTQFLLNQVQQLVQTQQYPQALTLIEQILQNAPQETATLVLKAQILGTTGRFPEALTIVEQLTKINERNPLPWSMRAVILMNLGQYQNSLQSIDRSLALDGNNPETQAIKQNIMHTIAMAAAQEKNRVLHKNDNVEPAKENRPLAFLIAIVIQILSFALGLAGLLLPASLTTLPTAISALVMGLGLVLLCVNAVRSTYRYGWIHLLPPFLTSVIAIASIVLGGLLNVLISSRLPANHQILNFLQAHSAFIIPMLVFSIWLAAVAVVPPVLAIGGLIAGAAKKRKKT